MLNRETLYNVTTATDAYVIVTGGQKQSLNAGDYIVIKTTVGNDGPFTIKVDDTGTTAVKIINHGNTYRDPYSWEFPANKVGEFRYDGTYWILLNPSVANTPSDMYEFIDDFDIGTTTSGAVGRQLWSHVNGGAGANAFTYETRGAAVDAVGVVRLARGAATGTSLATPSHGSGAVKPFLMNAPGLIYQARLAMVTASTSDKNHKFGLDENSDTTPGYGIFFSCVDGGNWKCNTVNASGTTSTDSGVAQSTDMVTFKFVVSPDRLTVRFYINDVLVVTHTDTIPALAGWPFLWYESTNSNALSWDFDYVSVRIPIKR